MIFKGNLRKARRILNGWTVDDVLSENGPEGLFTLVLSRDDNEEKLVRISASHLEWKMTELCQELSEK